MLERDKSSVIPNFETDIGIASTSSKIPGAYGIPMYVYGVRAVLLEDGGGPLGIAKVASLHVQSIFWASLSSSHMIIYCCIFSS